MISLSGWQSEPPEPAALTALLDACIAVDGVAPLSGHVLEGLTSAGFEFVSASDAGALIGIAVLPAHDPAELAVLPARRREGLGTQLLTAVLDRGSAVWAHGNLPAAAGLAAQLGLRTTRVLLQMRRTLATGLPPVELPPGVRIRTFVPGSDDAAFLAVNARAFAWHPEQGRLDAAGLAVEKAQDWFDPAGFFLAVDGDDRVLGYHWTKVHPAVADQPAIGEVYVLGVDPESPIRGLGTPLSIAGLSYLRSGDLAEVMLYVEGDNDRAVRLYERLGFTRYLSDVVYQR